MPDSRENGNGITIEVEDVGPVTEFEYQMSEPGLHVLTGKQGAGKTTILRTVQLACGESVGEKPTKRDGAKRGEATVAGKTLKIARAVREEGELTVDGMGDLNIAVIHNPGHKTPATRDKYRIAALVRLAGATPDISAFKSLGLTDEEWSEWVDEVAASTDDLVDMAGRVKRDIDKFGKHVEGQQFKAEQASAARLELHESVNVEVETDEAKLQAELESALQAKATVEQRMTEATESADAVARAREMVEAAEAGYDGPTSIEAEKQQAIITRDRDTAQAECERLSAELRGAQELLGSCEIDLDKARARFEEATRHEQTIADWRETIEQTASVKPTAEEQEAAILAVQSARTNAEAGRDARGAITARAEAEKLAAEAKAHRKNAKRIRDAAIGTQDVLSDAIGQIPDCPLRVKINEDGDARLVIKTDRDDNEPFDQLSDGEQWRTIVPLCCGPGKLVVLPQNAYGELSDSTRSLLDVLARQSGCFLLTAQATDGPLSCSAYQPVTDATVGQPAAV